MGGDLQGATLQVGKALQDPTTGMLALRRAGVSFSVSQQEVIKNLQATGDLAGAQSLILAELNKEFGGSAQADANTYAGQMMILKHEFANVKEEIGGIVMRLVIQQVYHRENYRAFPRNRPMAEAEQRPDLCRRRICRHSRRSMDSIPDTGNGGSCIHVYLRRYLLGVIGSDDS